MPRRLSKLLSLAAAALTLGGCSGTDVLNALVPEDGFSIQRDIPYGTDPRQKLDLYVPDGAGADSPLLVFFYGGRWDSGRKEQYLFAAQAFASRGYITAVPDYRLFPQVRWRGFTADAAAATAKAMDLAEVNRLGRPVYLAGHSAGAYLAMMIALDTRWLSDQGIDRRPDAVVGMAGPYNFLPLDSADLKAMFGPGEAGRETQPITFASGDDPPVLLLHGSGDGTVVPRNSTTLAEALRAAGARVETRLYEGVGHVRLVAALGKPLRFLAPVLDDADAFLSGLSTRPAAGGSRQGSGPTKAPAPWAAP